MIGSSYLTRTQAEMVGWGFWQEINFNCNHPDLINPDVRRGLSYLTDRNFARDLWLENYPLGEDEAIHPGLTSWLPSMPWYRTDMKVDNKVDKGLKLIEKAGYVLYDEELTLHLTLICPNTNPFRITWCEEIVTQWNAYGLSIDLVTMGWGDINDPAGGIVPRTFGHSAQWDNDPSTKIPTYEEGGFDLCTVGWSFGIDYTVDPIIVGHWEELFITDGIENFYQYSNPKFDERINEWIQTGGTEELASSIQNILQKDPPVIILFVYTQGL